VAPIPPERFEDGPYATGCKISSVKFAKHAMNQRPLHASASILALAVFGLMLCGSVGTLAAQGGATAAGTPDLTGVYQSISAETVLVGGLKNSGSPSSIALSATAVDQMKKVNVKEDPGRVCLPVGPFRMMARDRVKIELTPGPGMLVMLFEDLSRGHMRVIYLRRGHPQKVEPTWDGDSVGRWDGDRFVIDTVGFNDRTWLNESGAPHSEALHLVEQFHSVLGGKYLEYRMTAEDPNNLAKPYTYTRYFEKLATEIQEDVCEAE